MGNAAGCSNKKATKAYDPIEREAKHFTAQKASRILDDQRINLDKKEKFLMKKIRDENNVIEDCMSTNNRQGKKCLNNLYAYVKNVNLVCIRCFIHCFEIFSLL